MTNSNIVKHGVPVLAYLTPEPLSLSCSMRIFQNQGNQISIALRTSASLHSADDARAFVAQYDADNLLPGTAALDSATIHLPSEWRSEIARHADPQTTTLSLTFKQPCPLWCPRLDVLAPKPEPSSVASFNELVELAKATTVHIVFDYKWLHKDAQAAIKRLVKGKERLAGYPIDKYYAKLLKRKDWTVFAPANTAAAPPTYAGPCQKRTRQASGSTSPIPPPKRRVPDAQPPTQALSPTECATSPPTYANDEDEHDFQSRAISRMVRRHLPDVLKQVLPGVVPALFALPSSFTTSFDSEASQPPSLTPLGVSLVPHLVAHIHPQLQKMHTHSLSRVERGQQTAALEFEETVEEQKAELMQIASEGVTELHREATYALDEVRERGRDVAEAVSEEVEEDVRLRGDMAVSAVRRRLQTLGENGLRELGLEELVKREVERHYQCLGRVDDRQCRTWARRSWRRAGKGGYRGLGERWRHVPPSP